jgi:type I restriction enzyme R subunit
LGGARRGTGSGKCRPRRPTPGLTDNAEAAAPSGRAVLLQQSEQAAEAIELDEADTRLIIDAKLRAIGWQADTNRLRHALGTKPDPNGAIAIAEWPTESGPVDYALFLKGWCVGVIEAKKVGTDVPAVLEQTKRYARGVNLGADEIFPASPWQYGQDSAYRVPFVFATNGRPFVKQLATKSGIWFWDARGVTGVPGALPEWFNPQDIEEKLAQDLDADQHGLARSPSTIPGGGRISAKRSRQSRLRWQMAAARCWSRWPREPARRALASR